MSDFSTAKYSFFFSCFTLWKVVVICSPHIRNRWLRSTFLLVWSLHKLLGILMHDIFYILPYLLIQSLVYIRVASYMFISYFRLSSSTVSFVSCSYFSSFGYWNLFQLAPTCLRHTPITVFLIFLFSTSSLWDHKMLQIHVVYFLPPS